MTTTTNSKHPTHPTPIPSPQNNSFLQNSSPHALFRPKNHPFFPFDHGGLGLGSSFCNYSSSVINEGSEKIGFVGDVAEVLTEKRAELADLASQAPAVSEVAIAAADSYYHVTALQYLIDGVHSFTGLNWWASIALTTMLIRGATVPLLINQLKMMRPKLEEIKQEMQDRFYVEIKPNCTMNKPNCSPEWFSSAAECFPVWFFTAAECFPVHKDATVIKRPQVKKYLGILELPKTPTTQEQPAFSPFSAFKGLPMAPKESSTPKTSELPKTSERRISSSSVISQRVRNLEKQVKGREKNKRRARHELES